jgi:uncharacterized membrane protein
MGTMIKRYLVTLLAFLALDAVWLGVVAQPFYRAQIGFLMAPNPNWLAAGVFYLLYVAGLVSFVVEPAVRGRSPLSQAAWRGAFFGLVAYATYDLTNLATIDRWPLLVTIVDLAWGTTLGALTALIGVWGARRLEAGS